MLMDFRNFRNVLPLTLSEMGFPRVNFICAHNDFLIRVILSDWPNMRLAGLIRRGVALKNLFCSRREEYLPKRREMCSRKKTGSAYNKVAPDRRAYHSPRTRNERLRDAPTNSGTPSQGLEPGPKQRGSLSVRAQSLRVAYRIRF